MIIYYLIGNMGGNNYMYNIKNSYYAKEKYLRKMYKQFGLPDKIYLTDPYKVIRYGRQIEIFPESDTMDILNKCFRIKVISYNYIYDLLISEFKNCDINPFYYKKVFDDIINSCMLHSKEINIDLYNAVWDKKIPNDIILYAFASAQSVYKQMGDKGKHASYNKNNMIQMSIERLIAYNNNSVYIEPFGHIDTETVKPSIYKKRKILKIYKNEYDQYYMRLGIRKGEDDSSSSDKTNDTIIINDNIIIEKHDLIEL